MDVVNTVRTSKGPPKFCIDVGADWLLILDEVGGKSPGSYGRMIKYGSMEYLDVLFSKMALVFKFRASVTSLWRHNR